MKRLLFTMLALVLAIGLAIPMAVPVAAAVDIPDLPPSMPPGSGIFGTCYLIHNTNPGASSGYHWDDPATPLFDERVDPMHYYWASDPAHNTNPPGPSALTPLEAGSLLDFNWVWVGTVGDYAIWDMGNEYPGLRIYPCQDHLSGIMAEFAEYDVLGSNNPIAPLGSWYGGVQAGLYYGDLNPIKTHDGVRDFSFSGNFFRYIAVRTNSKGGGDFEIDAVEALFPPPGVEKRIVSGPSEVTIGQLVTWTIQYTISNPYDFTMQNIVVKDNFGANLNVAIALDPSQGTASVNKRNTGKSTQYRLDWAVGDLAPGSFAYLDLTVSTGQNPAAKQEFTSLGWHVLNSGATAKWINSETGAQESQVSGTIEVLVTPEPVVLFQDCFENGLANWNPIYGTWTTQSDAVHGTVYAETQAVDNSLSLGATAIAGSSAWTDYTFEVWVKALYNPASTWGMGPSYRVQTTSPYAQYVVQILYPGGSKLAVYRGTESSLPGSWVEVASVLTPSIVTGQWYKIVIDVNGSNHVVDVFDSANTNVGHLAFTDGTYTQGAIGLNAAAHSQFDCVKVTAN